jgi:transcription elongation factor/antiterminator RfaH
MEYRIKTTKTFDTSRWYVVHTHLRQESRAASNLEVLNIETYNPQMQECRYNQFTGKPITITKPLFPQYIFGRFSSQSMLHKVMFTRGVHNVVNFGSGPSPVDDEVIAFIKSQEQKDGLVRIGDLFEKGDRVEIKSGPLQKLVGVFDKEISGSKRVMILLDAVGFQGNIVVERVQVRKVSSDSQQAVAV